MMAKADGYEIGEAMGEDQFWSVDPVIFVQRHASSGFAFTSDAREGADSRLDGAVSYFGVPVFETKVFFAEGGGVANVEMLLYTNGGTESFKEVTTDDGRKLLARQRVEKKITRDEFFGILKVVREKLTKPGAKVPEATTERVPGDARQKSQTWAKGAAETRTTLVWNYEQEGKKTETFKAGFVRVKVAGPKAAKGETPSAAKGGVKIADNVVKDPRGDVFIDNVPMVDQGQKGYCAAATAERVLRYFGLETDEHDIAQAADTSAEDGTSTLAMKTSVEAIGKRYKLGTTVAYGDFEKNTTERIGGLVDEVRVYNKAAKKLRKPEITEDVYIQRSGNMTTYCPNKVDEAMDPEVRKEMRVNGSQKSGYTKFMKTIREQVSKGIPLFWGVTLGIYPEPGLPQTMGGHMRLIIGYNDKKKEVLYTDSWGAGHELKRMPADWAWTISHCLMYMKPLTR